jgi:hypothetical protein
VGSPSIVTGNDASRPAPQAATELPRDRRFVGFVVWVLLPVAWIGLTPPFNPPYQPIKRTRTALRQDSAVLHEFLSKYKKTPADLSSLRSFASMHHLTFAAYDCFGQRFDYQRLDNKRYLLRSFGEDQVQNSANSPTDMGVIHWGERPTAQLLFEPSEVAHAGLYPAALLPGADSPNLSWLARVFVDPVNRARHLVVRHLSRSGLFMVAPHDEVEEFLWLPSGDQIVFTATSSVRYRDGLFLWDLRTDQVVNLLDRVKQVAPLGPAGGADRLWLSLAGLGRRGPTVLTYVHPRHDGMLAPHDFFSPAHLVAIALPGEQARRARLASSDEYPAGSKAPNLSQRLDLRTNLTGGGGLGIQRRWLQQQFVGPVEPVLLAAQSWSMKAVSTPLFPYSLWILAGLYSESVAATDGAEVATRESLRAYGAEISRALLNYALAPSYLKALALYAYETLMDGKSLPYRFAQFPVAESPGLGLAPKPTQ